MMKFRVLISSLLLGCLLVISVQGDYSSTRAFSGHDEGDKNKLEVSGITAMFAQKESLEKNGAAHMRKLGLRVEKFISTEEETSMMVESKNGREGGTSKISGATYFDGIYDEFEGEHKIVKCKGKKSTIKPRKLKMEDFVAFSDDYRGPRHHLPKHN